MSFGEWEPDYDIYEGPYECPSCGAFDEECACTEEQIEAALQRRDQSATCEDWEPETFADPGGNSALRAATKSNPRDRSCPECGAENALTARDVALHYVCNRCADRAEGVGY